MSHLQLKEKKPDTNKIQNKIPPLKKHIKYSFPIFGSINP